MPKVRTAVVCLKASVAESTRFDMIDITSSKHVPWPITAPATVLPVHSVIVADTCCQYSGLLMQEATSKQGYIISQFAVSTSELGRAYILFDRELHPCYIVLDNTEM